MAGGIHQFLAPEVEEKGLCWKIESRRVLVARRLPHCIPTKVKK
jgi:hypothetical protein